MNCPKCEADSRVVDTREVNGQRQRKRKCRMGHIFYTNEVPIENWNYVDPRVKKPGTGYWRSSRAARKAQRLRKKPLGKIVLQKNSPEWIKSIYLKIND